MEEKNKNLELLESVAKDVLDKLGYSADVCVISNEKDPNLKILSVNSPEDSRILIGKNGQNISALEHVIKLLYFRKVTEGQVPEGTGSTRGMSKTGSTSALGRSTLTFMVDVNDYRKLRARQVLDKAIEAANRVITSKKAEAMMPMSSYERRLIHVELASYPDIETESIGEEPERRVVIKPLII